LWCFISKNLNKFKFLPYISLSLSQKSDILAKEIEDLRMKIQLVQKQRSNTVYISDDNVHAQLESELRQLRAENATLTNQLDELKAQTFKNDLDNGRMLLHLSANNGPSLAAEMGIMSKDEVPNRLRST
jgi:hypothetical protein